MPQLPDIEALAGAPGPQPAGGVAGYDVSNSASAGQMLSEGGREIQQAAAIMAETGARQDIVFSNDATNKLKQQSLALQSDKDGFQHVKGVHAAQPDFVSTYEQRFEDAKNSIGSGLTDSQKRLFERQSQVVRLQMRSALLAHQADESAKYQEQVDKDSILTQRMSVASDPTNEATFETAKVIVANTVQSFVERMGLPKESIAPMIQAETDRLIVAQVNGMRVTDPVGALSLLQRKRDQLSPEKFLEAEGHAFDAAAPVLAASIAMRGGMPGPVGSTTTGPRGVRNNNPLNIIQTSAPWDGEVQGGDSRFKTFSTPEAGLKAAGSVLLTYAEKHGINTVAGIISRWAPATENDTVSYVSDVAKAMGVDPMAPLNLRDKATMSKLFAAMIQRENRQQPYSTKQIESAIDSAINGTPIATGVAPAVTSWADITPSQALSIQTGDPVVDALLPQQKLHVLQLARSQAMQQQHQLRDGMVQRLQDSTAMYLSSGQASGAPTAQELMGAFGQLEGLQRWEALQNARQTGQALQQVKTLPSASLDAMLLNRPAEGEGFADRMRNYEVVAGAIVSVQKARQQDPVGYALAAGSYGLKPLTDLSDTKALTTELATRSRVAGQISTDYGTRLSLLTGPETKALESVLSKAPPEAQKQILGAVRSGVSDINQFSAVMQTLAPNQPLLAHAAMAQALGQQARTTQSGTILQQRDVADLILQGNAILNPQKSEAGKTSSLFKMPNDSVLRLDFNNQTGNAFTNKAASRDGFYQVARAIYAAKSVEEGDFATSETNDKAYNSGRWKEAVNLATGGVTDYQGGSVLKPWGMSDDDFKNAARARLIASAGNVSGMTAEDLASLPLQSRSDGQYYVMAGTGYVHDKQGQPLVIRIGPQQAASQPIQQVPPNRERELSIGSKGRLAGIPR